MTQYTPEQEAWLEARAHAWRVYFPKGNGWRARKTKPKKMPKGATAIRPALRIRDWEDFYKLWPRKKQRRRRT